MGLIRAKFRCLGIEKTWDGQSKVRLSPVMARDGHPENAKFWSASPTGEAKLDYWGDSPFVPGDYYYIDMKALGGEFDYSEHGWYLSSVNRRQGGGGEVVLVRGGPYDHENPRPPGLAHGTLEIGIEQADTLDLFGSPGIQWDVAFSFAEKSRD